MIRRMKTKNKWSPAEESELIKKYKSCTIKELMKILKNRSEDSINAKIKRMKTENKIQGPKNKETIDRAMRQRRRK